MDKKIILPKEKDMLGISLITQMALRYLQIYTFDYEFKYCSVKYHKRMCFTLLPENKLVLISNNELIHQYKNEEIKILKQKGYLKDLPKILEEKEKIKKKMFNKERIEKSAKTKIDIMKYQ